MKINITNISWIEISVSVMMYGTAVLDVEQKGTAVELKYTSAPDGYKETVKQMVYKDSRIDEITHEISQIDFEISPNEEEGTYISDLEGDASSQWMILFGKDDITSCEINGTDIKDKTFVTVFELLKDAYPFVSEFVFSSLID